VRGYAALLLLAGLLAAEEPSVSAIVSTVRYHPGGEPAAVGLRMLSRKAEPGWQALAALVLEMTDTEPAVARKAALALAEGPEAERLKIVAATYLQSDNEGVRAVLAEGLAYGYADHAPLLLRHMREDRPGAVEVARILAPEILPEEELRKLLSVTRLSRIVYDALLGRGLTVLPEECSGWARAIAAECIDPKRCREWASREPDFTILLAVAAALAAEEEDVRDGAQCLLLTVSGRKLHADADIWRSWIAGYRDRYARPEPASPGEIAAAIVRGARFLRRDLADDGCALLSYDHDRHHVIGSTALAVLALRAADCPATHPVIAKAVETTLLAFDKAGAPALRPIQERSRETYVLSLLAIALCDLDPARYRVPIEALRQRLLSGQQSVGAWGYRCFGPTDQGDPGRWDNSCTQYAVLALRAFASKGFAVPPETWQKIVGHLERGVAPEGRWDYCHGDAGNGLSMTAAGIGTLAIALEGLRGRDAPAAIRDHPAIAKGRAHLGRLLMEGGLPRASTYAFYGVERACILTATKTFRSANRVFGWYVAGARHLLATQTADGAMHGPEGDYGSALDTAYAILFLAKATRTIGGAEEGVFAVDLPPEKDVPEKPALPSPLPPPIPPRPPDLSVEWDRVPTRTGEAAIVGTVRPANATLLVDGKPVKPDARGRFFVTFAITKDGPVPVVARGADGLEVRKDVIVAFDLQAPRVRLTGPPQRHVGKQILVFRSDEPLRAISVAGRVYPADGPVVRAAVEVGEGKRTFSWAATDRAGNEGRGEMDLEAENRFLLLDGKSALRIDLPEQPREFTVECWVRGDEPAQAGSIVSNAQASGFGLYWASKHYNYPHGLVRCGGVFTAAGARRPWKWGSWTHLAFTYDGRAARFFANGKLHATVETKEPHVLSRFPLWIGAEPDGNGNPVDPFRGSIDEVRVSRGARYAADFRPERSFLRDDRTVALLHFDLDTLAEGLVLDDSGACRHATFVGQPLIGADGRGPAPSNVLAHAREELRREMPPPAVPPVTPEEREAEEAAARAEAEKRLGPVAVTVRVQTPQGSPVPGVLVRALHEALDLTADPVTTDAQGDAVVRLPRGPWRIDLSSEMPVVFARSRFAVRDEGREFVVLDRRRHLELRTAKGELRTPDSMTLAWPDLSFHRPVEAAQGQLEILTAGDEPMVVQAIRRPDDRGGYILRRTVGPGRTVLETEPSDATVHVVKGAGARRLDVRYTSADALPIDCVSDGNETREILLAGMPEVVLHFGSEHAGTRFRCYPRPFALDGKRIEFQGAPEFDVAVGFQRNTRSQYGDRVNSISFRVLLTTASGLLLSPDAPYTISWQQMLDGKPRASGTTRPTDPVWTAPLDPAAVAKLRYALHIRGPGVNRKLEVEGSEHVVAVQEGRVRTWCFPAVEASARAWARCIGLAVRAYEETCPYRVAHLDVERSMHMPLPVIGMGGYGGDNGWMWLPGDTVYGFSGTSWWTGLLSHELGHVFRYGHSNPFENNVMVQAGRRAGRRLESIRPGMERVPEGNRYRALIDAVEEEEEGVRGAPGDATGDGVLVPNLEITGDDAVFVWYYRSQFGEAAQAARRKYGAAWSWLLTLRGFTDEEIRIAMLSRAAGTSLAWLARMRGIDVRDRRIAEAFELLGAAGEALPWQDKRDPVLGGWAGWPLPADLTDAESRMRAELGDRRARVAALLRIAREHILRGDPARGEETIVSAMAEARLGGPGALDAALRDAAPLWAGR
jgi:hypothetical protein